MAFNRARRHWHEVLTGSVDTVANQLVDIILDAAKQFIPKRQVSEFKCSNLWLNDRCRKAIAQNIAAEHQDNYEQECMKCTAVIKEEYVLHTNKLNTKLAGLPKSGKQWWRRNRELMNNVTPKEPIPPLKSNGKWLEHSKDKAHCLAKIFSEKCKLPEHVGEPDVRCTRHHR